jgi:hypothetical protein
MDELVARAVRASRAEASIPDVVALRPAPAVTRGVTRPDLQDDDAANVA